MGRYTTEIKRLYEVLEKRLGQAPYLGGDEYSIADIATFPWTRNHDAQGVKWEDNPESRALVQRHQRASGGEGRARQGRRHQVEPRDRLRRPEGPLLQPRPLRPGVIVPADGAREGALDLAGKAAVVTGSSSGRTASAANARSSSPRAAATSW